MQWSGVCLQAVDVKKLQGTEMNVSTERGPLKVKAIYAESSCVSSCSGRVELGHVHGEQMYLHLNHSFGYSYRQNSNNLQLNISGMFLLKE